MSHPSVYKPSPLSFASPRTSPFRRPESPASPSTTTLRPSTPQTPLQSPSKIQTASATTPPSNDGTWTPRGLNLLTSSNNAPRSRDPSPSPTRGGGGPLNNTAARSRPAPPMTAASMSTISTTITNTTTAPAPAPSISAAATTFTKDIRLSNSSIRDPLTRLPPSLIRSMREAYSLLDRSSTGSITPADLSETLSSLNLPCSPPSLVAATYFPQTQAQNSTSTTASTSSSNASLSLPTFLSTLSTLLAPLSSEKELLAAFEAFDTDDSGQVDVGVLKEALLSTSGGRGGGMGIGGGGLGGRVCLSAEEVDEVLEGFKGRRAFGTRGGGGGLSGAGDVFRYGEFVASVLGNGAVFEEDGGGEGK